MPDSEPVTDAPPSGPPEPGGAVTRREFFRSATLAGGALMPTGLPVWNALARQMRLFVPVRICGVEELEPGSSLPFAYPRKEDDCLLVRTADGKFHAFSRRCTHLGCLVDWDRDKARLQCPCHGGAYDIASGEVVDGPPPNPLPEVLLKVQDGAIWAVGMRRGTP